MKESLKTALLYVPGGSTILRLVRSYRLKRFTGGTQTPDELFARYYSKNVWGSSESRSGPGSTLENTVNIRKEIPVLLEKLSIRRILDAPCGDYNWFQHIQRSADTFYIGGDIVGFVIEENQAKFGNENTKFVTLDITQGQLPAADLWLCRDVLFHLSNAEVFRVFSNFLRSEIQYFLTTSHTACPRNSDIPTGSFRQINLQRAPFNLPEPILSIDDWVEGNPVSKLCLWTRDNIKSALAGNT